MHVCAHACGGRWLMSNDSALLFRLIHEGKASQSNPELANMGNPISRLFWGSLFSTFQGWITNRALCPSGIYKVKQLNFDPAGKRNPQQSNCRHQIGL